MGGDSGDLVGKGRKGNGMLESDSFSAESVCITEVK